MHDTGTSGFKIYQDRLSKGSCGNSKANEARSENAIEEVTDEDEKEFDWSNYNCTQ